MQEEKTKQKIKKQKFGRGTYIFNIIEDSNASTGSNFYWHRYENEKNTTIFLFYVIWEVGVVVGGLEQKLVLAIW